MKRTILLAFGAMGVSIANAQSLPFRVDRYLSGLESYLDETPLNRTTVANQTISIVGEFHLTQAMWRDDMFDPAPWASPFNGTLTDPDHYVSISYNIYASIPAAGTYYWVRLSETAQSGYEKWRIRYEYPSSGDDGPPSSVVKTVTRHYNWYIPNGSPSLRTSS